MYDFDYSCSEELCEKMASECDTAILAFSRGKDSIAAWLQMRKYFKRIIPYYCYTVPEMKFVEDSLYYYEDFFGQAIFRLPHRSFYRYLATKTFQPPDRWTFINNWKPLSDDAYNDRTIVDMIQETVKLPECVFCGNGVRMADSPVRRISTIKYGAISFTNKRFYPVYDWKKADLIRAFNESGVKLPIDYKIWGRTFDGLDYRFIKPMKEYLPDDYQKLLEWYPFAELEIARRDGFDTIMYNKREGV